MKKEKEQKQKKKLIDWKRTFKNNGYMLGLIIKACPGVPILALISTVLGSAHSFLLNTYLYINNRFFVFWCRRKRFVFF